MPASRPGSIPASALAASAAVSRQPASSTAGVPPGGAQAPRSGSCAAASRCAGRPQRQAVLKAAQATAPAGQEQRADPDLGRRRARQKPAPPRRPAPLRRTPATPLPDNRRRARYRGPAPARRARPVPTVPIVGAAAPNRSSAAPQRSASARCPAKIRTSAAASAAAAAAGSAPSESQKASSPRPPPAPLSAIWPAVSSCMSAYQAVAGSRVPASAATDFLGAAPSVDERGRHAGRRGPGARTRRASESQQHALPRYWRPTRRWALKTGTEITAASMPRRPPGQADRGRSLRHTRVKRRTPGGSSRIRRGAPQASPAPPEHRRAGPGPKRGQKCRNPGTTTLATGIPVSSRVWSTTSISMPRRSTDLRQ